MRYKNPGATIDLIIEKNEKILLIERKYEPFKGKWALPGGFIDYGKETLEKAAVREGGEETSLKIKLKDLEFFGVYSSPNRDPRGHIISHVYIVKKYSGELKANDDAKQVRWFPLYELPKLAFDHKKIINDYRKRSKKCLKKF